MKKVTLVFLLMAFMGFSQIAKAQNIAHINSMELLEAMDEKKKADEQLRVLADQKKAEIKKQEDAFAEKYKKYNDLYGNKSQTELEKLKNEIQKVGEELQKDEQNLTALREEAMKALDKKQQDLYDPITKKAQEAVNAVAKDKGYLYIFDTSQPGIIYAQGPNILSDVKAKLGLK